MVALAVLWPLFQVQYFGGFDGQGRIKILISILAIIVNGQRLFSVPKVMHIRLLWVIFCIINAYFKGFYFEATSFPNWAHHRLFYPYIIMLLGYQVITYDVKKSIWFLFGVYFIYTAVGALNLTFMQSYDIGDRLGNDLGNAYFNTIVLLMTYSALMFTNKRLSLFTLLLISLSLAFLLVISGERKGLIAVFIIIIGSYLGLSGRGSAHSVVRYLIIFGIAYFAVEYVVQSTTFGVRMENSIENSEFQGNWFLTLMGDRGIQYYEGWQFFLKNPMSGIGIRNFAEMNSFWFGGAGVLHSEYMVQLAECGIIGTVMFIIFYYGLLNRVFNIEWARENHAEATIFKATMVAIMAINLVSWSYDNENIFLMYGVIYAYCGLSKNDKRQA